MEEWKSEAGSRAFLENSTRLAQEGNALGNEVWDRGQQRMKVSERMGEEKDGCGKHNKHTVPDGGRKKSGKRKCRRVRDW